MREMTETKKKGFTTLLRITALIAALVTAGSFALPSFEKQRSRRGGGTHPFRADPFFNCRGLLFRQ